MYSNFKNKVKQQKIDSLGQKNKEYINIWPYLCLDNKNRRIWVIWIDFGRQHMKVINIYSRLMMVIQCAGNSFVSLDSYSFVSFPVINIMEPKVIHCSNVYRNHQKNNEVSIIYIVQNLLSARFQWLFYELFFYISFDKKYLPIHWKCKI